MTIKRKRTKLEEVRKRKSSPEDLSSRAMLVKLRISRWGAKTNDQDVVNEVAERKHSEASYGKYTKSLLRSEHLRAYKIAGRECRKIHKHYTSQWDTGVGLLPASLYFDYTKSIGEKRREADRHVKAFVAEYADQWNKGLKEYRKALGDLFNEEDYPEPKYVEKKFGIQIRIFPIQDPNDFRVQLSGDTSDKLKKEMHSDFQDSLREAMKEPVIRLQELVTKVHEKLADENAIFRDSLIENVRELVEILPKLNVLDDPDITSLIHQTKKGICSVSDTKALRHDAKYRKEVSNSAKSILKSMKGMA